VGALILIATEAKFFLFLDLLFLGPILDYKRKSIAIVPDCSPNWNSPPCAIPIEKSNINLTWGKAYFLF